MISEKGENYLLVVDISGEKQQVFDGIKNVAGPFLDGMSLEMMWTGDPLGCLISETHWPFYTRGLTVIEK